MWEREVNHVYAIEIMDNSSEILDYNLPEINWDPPETDWDNLEAELKNIKWPAVDSIYTDEEE